MNNWKIIGGVILGSLALVFLAVWGLGKVSTPGESAPVNVDLTTGARWIKENGNVKVTVVEFSDLQCPACKTAEPVARALRNMDGVKFVYRHFPLTMLHQNSWKAARAAEAARSLEKGFEMMDSLFAHQEEWSALSGSDLDNKFKEYAAGVGMDGDKFMAAYNSPDSEKGVKSDSDLAINLKLNGTPTFFVDGKLSASNLILEQVKQILQSK